MGTYLNVLSESYQMNTNMEGFRWFSKSVVSLCFGQTKITPSQGLSQDLETGCPNLSIVKFWASYFSRKTPIYSDYNHNRAQH